MEPQFVESGFEPPLQADQGIVGWDGGVLFGLEEIHREGCHERARDDERGNHGEDHRFSQRDKKVMGDAAEKEHRQKHHADAQRRDQQWSTDLLRTHQDGVLEDLALLKVALDIFNRDCPAAPRAMTEERIDIGIEIAMMSVLRQLPRKSSIIAAVSTVATTTSRMTPFTAPFTKMD